jgi:hypothetical protein
MDKRHVLIVLALTALVGCVQLAGYSSAFAAFDTMVVNIEGTELTNIQSATVDGVTTYYIDIAGTSYQNGCATYKIEPNSTTGSPPANLARVEAFDGSSDTLWLRNAKITATSDCVDDAHIYFWARFQGPPNTGEDAAKPKVTVQRNANGVFTPAVTGNWISITSHVQNPVNPDPPDGLSGTWQDIGPDGTTDSHVVTCGTCGVFGKSRSKTWSSNFTGERLMKADFHFKLENNSNKLVFDQTTAKGIKIYTTTSAGDR